MIHRHIHKALKHTFIPHEGNDYRPHFFREHVVLSIVIISILSLLLSVTSYLIIRKTAYGTLVASSVLIDFTNRTREGVGLSPLIRNDLLQESSHLKAEEMSSLHYFAHESPDGGGPWKFFKQAHYPFVYAGENLALNFNTSKQVHEGWLASKKHKDNIVDNKFKEIGISVLPAQYEGRSILFVVQHFGLPKDTSLLSQEKPVYSSFFERLLFSGSSYVETFYFFLIGLVLMATVLLIIIETEKKHMKHIVYGVLMLAALIILTLINAELLS